mmetsp:Transcript_2163/g.4814  ORF Transcript_2163/g.4814 Transcript_2163/m.4814 type:complete len:276 (-) Transcript_2163:126-953(-)
MAECMVLAGDFALSVQVLLAVVVLCTLLCKWLNERWRAPALLGPDRKARSFLVFAMDSSKQMAGAGWIHMLSLLSSEMFASAAGDQCEWYLINIVLDTTIGCALQYLFLHAASFLLKRACGVLRAQDWTESGHYYDSTTGQFRPRKYLKQLLLWVAVVVTLMKLTVLLLAYLFRGPLVSLAGLVLRPLSKNAKLELLFVMVGMPSLMNALQFWVGDNIIKKRLCSDGPQTPLTTSIGQETAVEVAVSSLAPSSLPSAAKLQHDDAVAAEARSTPV